VEVTNLLIDQDYTKFEETDIGADRLSVDSASLLTITALDCDEVVMLTYDFGTDFFSGNFEARVKINVGAASSIFSGCCFFGLSNDDTQLPEDQSKYFEVYAYNSAAAAVKIYIKTATADTEIVAGLTEATDYYIKINRDTTVGTWGQARITVYSDAAYSVEVGTGVQTFVSAASDGDYSILHAMSALARTGGKVWTGTIENLEITLQKENDVYIIGKETGEIFDYRVMTMDRTEDTTKKITVLEYDDTVYYHNDYNGGAVGI